MSKKPFKSKDQITRAWNILDGISRRAWENFPKGDPQGKLVHEAAGKFYSELIRVCKDLPQKTKVNITQPPSGINADDSNWSQFANEELVYMVGREDINSVSEAYLKTKSLLRALANSISGHKRFLFRGQQNITWTLLPRKGRALNNDPNWTPPANHLCDRKLTRILKEELESLAIFQSVWDTLQTVDAIDRQKYILNDHPEWWFRMQHYDPDDGTRLLDVTTSLNAALLFACIDWDSGAIDDQIDGVIYFLVEGNNCNVEDFLIHQLPKTANGLFSEYPDAPRFILNPPHNERSKAQSGAFLWWPKFWEEPPYADPHYLRVPKEVKKEIVTDLLSMGFGPKEAVRGIKGLENERALRKQLGLPDWVPLELVE